MALSVAKNITLPNLNAISFSINKRLYFEGIKYDFYRKCLLPLPENDYLDITMIGRGEPYKKKLSEKMRVCNSYYGSFVCDCEETKYSKMNYCYRSSCKICFHRGVSRQVDRIVERLEKIEKLEEEPFQLVHYSFNIMYPINDIDSFNLYKAKLNRILKKYDMDLVLVFHPYRKDWEKIKEGIWQVKKFPHFHGVGRGKIIDGGSFFRKHGFTYKNITYEQYKKGKRDKPYLETFKDVSGVLRYVLSHASVLSSRMKNYSYLGKFSPYWYNKVNKIHEYQEKICLECGDQVHYIEKEPFIEDKGGVKRIIRRFRIERDVGKPFFDLYVYDRDYLYVYKDKVCYVLIDTYDLVYRDFSKKKKVKSIYRDYYGTTVSYKR